jgi:hypothetical protein
MRASNDATSIERADKLEKREKIIKYGAMLTAFMLGSAVDIYHGLTDVGVAAADHAAGAVGNAVEHATAQASNATEAAHAAGVPTTGVSEMADAASAPTVADVATPTPVPTPVPVDAVVSAAPTEVLHNHLVSQGDSLGKLFKQPEFSKLLPGFDEIPTEKGRNNYLMNFFEKLTPDQLKSVGITSGSADLIKIDENLNMEKLASYAKDMKVPTKSGLMDLFRRATNL